MAIFCHNSPSLLAVLTCGHCVYSSEHGGFAKSVKVIPAMNGENSAPLGTAYALGASIGQSWIDN